MKMTRKVYCNMEGKEGLTENKQMALRIDKKGRFSGEEKVEGLVTCIEK